jgi:putative FmdB family regulatory protein
MPTYEYECKSCGLRFERQQPITERPIRNCPQCHGEVHRLISGGAGFILKGARPERAGRRGEGCSLEQMGRTCCGRDQRCGKPPCGGMTE